MRNFMVLLLLAGGGWYYYTYHMAPATPVASDAGPEANTATSAPAASDADASDGSALDLDGQADPATPPPAAQRDGLTAQGEALLAQADATWKEIESAGRNPLTDNLAPTLARQYSAVLRETYGFPALAPLAERLVEQRLRPLADKIFFSSVPYLKDPSGFIVPYEIDGQLNDIGRKFGLSYQLINLMRGVEPENGLYHEGDQIKIAKVLDHGGYWLHIDKSDYRMDVYIGGVFARRYPIAHGADETPTPTGETIIEGRVKDPQWTDPKTGNIYDAGDPNNILGGVWLPFHNRIGRQGLGIHGYTGEDGQATHARASNGCIRMTRDDAQDLYNILVPAAYYQSGFKSRAPMRVVIVE